MWYPRIAAVCEPFPTVWHEGVAPGGRVAACRSGGPGRRAPYHLSRESAESHARRRCRVVDWPGSAVCRPGRRTIRHGRAGCASTQCPLLPGARSEEHTSELQSHSDLVCRLLLEKKK